MRSAKDAAWTLSVIILIIGLTWLLLKGGGHFGAGVLALALLPAAAAMLSRQSLKGLLPDIVFGAIDSGLLVVAAALGALNFGLAGAIVGGVVGDALTDGIAGFFEGGLAQWLRAHGIRESRTALGSALGKMCGCLAGSGLVLTLVQLAGLKLPLAVH